MTSIPAEAVRRLRAALRTRLGGITEEIDAALRPGHEQRIPEVLRHFDFVRNTLDEIGWVDRHVQRDVEIGLFARRPVIVAALREQLDMERQLADTTDPRERARAETNVGVIEELLAMIEASAPMATVPADAVLRIREALYAQLGKAAEDLADASWKPERGAEWAEPVARFDRNRALLDEIGWNEPGAEWAEIDLDTHWQTIVTALHWDLGTYEHLADTQDADQRERATANAAAIERLLGELEGGDDDRA